MQKIIFSAAEENPMDIFRNLEKEEKENQGKRLSIEKIYQKKSQLEHILLRPDTYIGSVEYTDRAVCLILFYRILKRFLIESVIAADELSFVGLIEQPWIHGTKREGAGFTH